MWLSVFLPFVSFHYKGQARLKYLYLNDSYCTLIEIRYICMQVCILPKLLCGRFEFLLYLFLQSQKISKTYVHRLQGLLAKGAESASTLERYQMSTMPANLPSCFGKIERRWQLNFDTFAINVVCRSNVYYCIVSVQNVYTGGRHSMNLKLLFHLMQKNRLNEKYSYLEK